MNSKTLFPVLLALFTLGACHTEPEPNASEANAESTEPGYKMTADKKVILFFGNSLTAAYGVKPEESFPGRIRQRLDSLGYNYQVVNAGVSGETTSGGLGRIDWVLSRQEVDIFVLELGANDGLRGIPVKETRQNLKKLIDKVRAKNPDVEIILAGMMVPPNMGPDYSQEYEAIFPEVAQTKEVDLIPFLLKDVGGVDSLNQDDGIHPNPKGAKIVAQNVWEVLEGHLEKSSPKSLGD